MTDTLVDTESEAISPAPSRLAKSVLLVSAALWIALGSYLLLTTNQQVLEVGGRDLLGHFVLFLFVSLSSAAAVFALAGRRRFVWTMLVVGVVVAAASELVQGAVVGDRDAQWYDFAADVAGVVAGLGLAVVVARQGVSLVRGVRTAAVLSLVGLLGAGGVVGAALFELEDRWRCRDLVQETATDLDLQGLSGRVLLHLDESGLATAAGTLGPDAWGERAPSVVADGVAFDGDTAVAGPPGLTDALACGIFAADEITVVVSFSPSDLEQTGPVRLLTVANGTDRSETDFHVGQQADGVSVRARTSADRLFTTVVPSVLEGEQRQVVVVSIAEGLLRLFTSSGASYEEDMRGDALAGWDPARPVTIGDELSGDRAFTGVIHELVVMSVAVTDAEAQLLISQLSG